MKGLPLVVVTCGLLAGDAFAQPESVADLKQRVAALELAVEEHRQHEIRIGLLAAAFVIGLTGFVLYRRRQDSLRAAERMSVTDPLTGLKNRRYVTQTIGADCGVATRHHRNAMAAGHPPPPDSDLMFVLIDIDDFKAVNDRHGHAAGDAMLSQIADVIRATCRTSDVIARWGGAEFLAILRFTNRETAPISVERIRMAVEQRLFDLGDGHKIGCTCSIGFAPYPLSLERPEEASWEQVVALADEALQRAKQSGRNTWVGADTSLLAFR